MKKSWLFIFLVIAAALAAVYFYNKSREPQPENRPPEQTASAAQWETKTDDRPPVAVRITPAELGKNSDVWKFEIAFDTHSGSLDGDPMETITLRDGRGGVHRPVAWEGGGPGGHHREGLLLFNAIIPPPAFAELRVADTGGIPERIFKWNLE